MPTPEASLEREKKIVRWLDEIKHDAHEIYLVGDLFDVWFEYRRVAPRGFVRLLGKIAEINDSGIPVILFTGNHDMWMFDYLPKELGVTVYRDPVTRQWNGKKFMIGHGDGLGPGDRGYKFIKSVFRNKVCQFLFARFHPNFGIWLADYFSRKGQKKKKHEARYMGDDKEYLVQYFHQVLQKEHFDFFIFGHRHLAIDMKIGDKSQYVNLGDWISYNTYAVFDGDKLELKTYQ